MAKRRTSARYRMTPARRAALRKAQLASARKRRKPGNRSQIQTNRKRRRRVVVAGATVATVATGVVVGPRLVVASSRRRTKKIRRNLADNFAREQQAKRADRAAVVLVGSVRAGKPIRAKTALAMARKANGLNGGPKRRRKSRKR